MVSMKRTFVTAFILCLFGSVYAQQDLIDRVAKQAVEIDSLKRVVQAEKDNHQRLSTEYQQLRDTLKILEGDLSNVEKFKADRQIIDTLLQQKSDSITLLQAAIAEKNRQILTERQQSEQKATEEKERGKQEVLTHIINHYTNNSFDDLLKSSTKLSTQRDLQFVGISAEVKLILSDLQKYLGAKELLEIKFDGDKIKNAQNQLNQIKQESELLDKLKEAVDRYQMFNDGLKEVIEKLITLDQREIVDGMPDGVQKQKLDKILAEISPFIFNYDFNFMDYPYLSDILLEIFKRKQPNKDADISDLLKQL